MRPSRLGSWLAGAGLTLVLGTALGDGSELTGDAAKATTARELTLELSTDEADKALASADPGDPLLALERARVHLYRGECTQAAAVLARPDLAESDASASLAAVARGCERSMAGAIVKEQDGVWLRFQDDADEVLAPFLVEVAGKAREVFQRDLGVTMPSPIRVEIVRDQMGLSALTGLPLSAARTTGTIGIAKWGRVVIVSPRGAPQGYAFMDTLAHELTHLALTRGSGDRAPLWLQEGVARLEESKWRAPLPFDDLPPADDVALFGVRGKIGPDIDKIGPSIALLPSSEQAMVTYAKVQSFMKYYGAHAGDGAMPKLLSAFKDAKDPDQLDKVIEDVTGTPLSTWNEQWLAELAVHGKELPEDLKPNAPPPKDLKEVRKRVRLGQLMLARKHGQAAVTELAKGHEKLPRQALVRGLYARALVAVGKEAEAKALVEKASDVPASDPTWWSMRGRLGVGDANEAARTAVSLAPYDPPVACTELEAPSVPSDPVLAALCRAARQKPQGD
jgi:hypothetical protein